MSWWGPSAQETEFSNLLDKTTSDLLPSSAPPDLAETLHLADLIRSTSLPPASASKILLKRLLHQNPNVQLLTLQVVDICIKNGGTPFLQSIAAKDGADELARLAEVASNRDVREKTRALVQDWATAFEGKRELADTELVRMYARLRREGVEFPKRDERATAAMVDSLSAPEWTDATYCTRCRTDFSTFNRKHHCRNCGRVFDQQCSSQTSPLPHFGVTEPVRVCDGCVKSLKEGGKGHVVPPSPGLNRSTSLGAGGSSKYGELARSATYGSDSKGRNSHKSSSSTSALGGSSRRRKEEDDLAKAIAASLADAGGGPSSTAGPAFQLRDPAPKAPAKEEEDDPDLAAAIAASLRESAPAPSAPGAHDAVTPAAVSYSQLYPGANSYFQPESQPQQPQHRFAPLPNYDLSAIEHNTLQTFSNALEHPPPALGTRERELYEQARAAAPRLERGLDDAARRREILVEMNQKLGEATRLYEGLLDERVRQAARSPQLAYSPYATQQPYQHQQYAPPSQAPVSQPQYANAYPSLAAAPLPPTHYAPQTQPKYEYHPQPMGQPLPQSVLPPQEPVQNHQQYEQQHQQPPQQQQQLRADAQEWTPQAQQQPQPVQHEQQQQPQPAGYYTQKSFPQVPNGPLPNSFPQVPQETPWEQQHVQEAPVGELIEL